ncbi:MAG: hypothetical protein J5590_00440 [Clostridia bacterium]|nr:hypothetical protein [Clostridia bacterium]
MLLVFEIIGFCVLFTLLVRLSAVGGAVNALYFYPEKYQRKAISIGLSDRQTIKKKKMRFMLPFCIILLTVLVILIGAVNRNGYFKNAYLQSLLFLEIMNIYDGIIIDKVWVGYGRLWKIKGMEGVPYIQSWGGMFIKRGILAILWLILAAIPAGIVTMLF